MAVFKALNTGRGERERTGIRKKKSTCRGMLRDVGETVDVWWNGPRCECCFVWGMCEPVCLASVSDWH